MTFIRVLATVVIWPSVSAAASPAREDIRQSYVLIVAHNKSLDADVEPLRFADDDGARYFELLSPGATRITLLSQLDADTRRLHPDLHVQSPTRSNLMRALARLNAKMAAARQAGVETDFYFIYTGHGAVEQGEGYVNLADGRLSRTDLFDAVIKPSQAAFNHIIIDACRSYYMVYGRGDDSQWQEDRLDGSAYAGVVAAYHNGLDLAQYANTGVILSTSSDVQSHEWSGYGAGVFSHQLRSALAGAAEVDGRSGVGYLEVDAYLAAANAAVVDPKARVAVHVRAPRGDPTRPMFRPGPSDFQNSVVLAAHLSGKIFVQDDRGVRYADFHKSPDRSLTLVLPGHDRKYLLGSSDGEIQLVPGVAVSQLHWQPISFSPRNAVSQAYRKHLYELPFSREFFAGFRLRSLARP